MPGAKGKSGGPRAGAGRSTFRPSAEQRNTVELLSAFRFDVEDMHLFVKGENGKPISEPTLRKHFAKELRTGKLKARFNVSMGLYKNATRPSKKSEYGDVSAQDKLLKRLDPNWDNPQRVELTGKDGGPIQNVNMTTAEFQEAARAVLDEI